jgi:hypothetical protein
MRKGVKEMVEEGLLFLDDISRIFRISKNTLQRKKWREQKGIPLHKIGKKLCGFKNEIERWAKSQ